MSDKVWDLGERGAGRLEGFQKWEGYDPWEEHTGPFYFREEQEGYRCAFEATGQHVNGGGAIHGGCLMTFADYCLFVFAKPVLEGSMAVTVSFSSEFVGAGLAGDFVQGVGEIVEATGSLVFVRGMIYTERDGNEHPVILLNFSGILKKIRR